MVTIEIISFEIPRIQLIQKEVILMYSIRPGHLVPNDYIKAVIIPNTTVKRKQQAPITVALIQKPLLTGQNNERY